MKMIEELERSVGTGTPDILVDSKALMGFLSNFLPRILGGAVVGTLLGAVVSLGIPRTFEGIAYLEVTSTPLKDLAGLNEGSDQMGLLVKTVEAESVTPSLTSSVKKNMRKGDVLPRLSFQAKNVPGTRLIRLRVRGSDQVEALAGANAWAKAVVDSFNNQRTELFQASDVPLTDYYGKSVQKLDGFEFKIRELSGALEIKQAELAAIKKQNAEAVGEVTTIGPQIQMLTATLPILMQAIEKAPPVLPQAQSEQGRKTLLLPSGEENGKVMGFISYGSNPLFLELSKKISDTEINLAVSKRREEQLRTLIKEGEKKQELLSRQVNKSLLAISQMERDLGVIKSGFDFYSSRVGQIKLSGELLASNVRIVSLAEESFRVSYLFHCLVIGFTGGIFILSIMNVRLLNTGWFSSNRPLRSSAS